MRLKPIGSNQTELVKTDGTVLFFSYETPVAGFDKDGHFRTEEKFSVTTTKHINRWLFGMNYRTVSQAYIKSLL